MAQLFSDQLETWLKSSGKKTLGEMDKVFGVKGFAVAALILMTPSALPLPTGGITHIFELIVMTMALGLMVGKQHLWLPRGLDKKPIGSRLETKALPKFLAFIRWFERRSHPRLSSAMSSQRFMRVAGLTILILTVATFLAPPFSGLDTLPSLGVVLICLAILLEDALIVLLGLLSGIVGIILEISLGSLAWHFLH